MHRAAGLASVLALAACGDVGTAERLSSRETLDGIDVPTIGTVGDFPDPAHRHVVNVTADGQILVDGATLTYYAMVPELRRRAALSETPIPDAKPPRNLSGESIVLRLDGALPWGAAQDLVMECAEASIWRVFFAVRHESGDGEGAVAVFTTRRVHTDGDDQSLVELHVSVWPRNGRGAPAALFAELRKAPALLTPKLVVVLDVERDASTRTVLALLDASLRAGATDVEFALGAPPKRGDADARFAADVARPRDARVTYNIRTWDAKYGGDREGPARELVPATPPVSLPTVARARGALVGVTR